MIIANADGNAQQSPAYSWINGTINKAGTAAATNLTSITAFADLFTPFQKSTLGGTTGNARKPYTIKLTADGTIYVKINGGNLITLSATVSFSATDLQIDSIYVSDNSGSKVLTVYLQ